MKEELQTAINSWYRQWCLINDPFEEDFQGEVYKVLPEVTITYDTHNSNYIVL